MQSLRTHGLMRFAAFWAVSILVQWSSGAYRAEAIQEADEPAHIVSGVMLRDYVTSGLGSSPIAFATDYYQHYPKVAIGHWPPLFYVEQAAWTLLFPSSRASLLVMMALQAALLAILLWTVLYARFGEVAAWLGSLVLLTLPGIARGTGTIMTEVPIALIILLAVLEWGKYLENSRTRHAVAFGLWAAAAIMMKGTGFVLAPVPLLSVWLAGRIDLLRKPSFWYPAFIVLICDGAWYLKAPGALHQHVVAYGGVGFESNRIPVATDGWSHEFGSIIIFLALLGIAIFVYLRLRGSDRKQKIDGALSSAVALTIAAIVSPFFVAAWETRHLTESAPAILLVACYALGWLASLPMLRRVGGSHAGSYRLALLTLGAGATIFWNLQTLPSQHARGYRQLADSLVSNSLGPAQAVVVVGDVAAEGAIIAEVALQQPRPLRYILRGTKLFADVEWMGRVRELKVHDSADVDKLLTDLPVDLIVVDRKSPSPYAYQALLEEAIAAHPEKWNRVEYPANDSRFGIFRRRDVKAISLSELGVGLQAGLPRPLSPQ